jgi:glycosyltransferase involved in cell wall biosynthesis
MSKATKVLFITWDGPGSFYLESLFLPIFRGLADKGIIVHILQFSWASQAERSHIEARFEGYGITYNSIQVLRFPLLLGNFLTILFGAWHIKKTIQKFGIDILMPRSTLPAIASLLALKAYPNTPLLFDADGLPHDERIDFGGLLPNSIVYRLLRDFESLAVRRADAILTRSLKAIDILVSRAGAGVDETKFSVVSNGRDPSIFKIIDQNEVSEVRRSLEVTSEAPLIVYIGSSVQGKYCGREMLLFFSAVLKYRHDARLLLLTSASDEVDSLLSENEALRDFCIVKSLPPDQVPMYLAACDLGLVLIHQTFSMQAVAAIKLGEYLLCGVPVLSSSRIGDSSQLIKSNVGRLLEKMTPEEFDASARWFLTDVMAKRHQFRIDCRDLGLDKFSLEATIEIYNSLLKSIKN